MAKKVRIVEIPQEVRDTYNTDPGLARLKHELRSVGGKLGALTAQYRRQAQLLQAKVGELQEQVRRQKVELVHEHGWAFASLEELNQRAGCRSHPKANVTWTPTKMLAKERGVTTVMQGAMCGRRIVDGGASVRGELARLKHYELKCTECYLGGEDPPDKVAHDCPNCGIVRGSPQKFHEGGSVYQNSYIYYHCQLCGEELGYVVFGGLVL